MSQSHSRIRTFVPSVSPLHVSDVDVELEISKFSHLVVPSCIEAGRCQYICQGVVVCVDCKTQRID